MTIKQNRNLSLQQSAISTFIFKTKSSRLFSHGHEDLCDNYTFSGVKDLLVFFFRVASIKYFYIAEKSTLLAEVGSRLAFQWRDLSRSGERAAPESNRLLNEAERLSGWLVGWLAGRSIRLPVVLARPVATTRYARKSYVHRNSGGMRLFATIMSI